MIVVDVLLRTVLPFAGLLVGLVVLHELGHYFAAKAFGVKVLEFGIGFPPRIKGLSWRRGETEYTLNWLPIGGFVRLLGETDIPFYVAAVAERDGERAVALVELTPDQERLSVSAAVGDRVAEDIARAEPARLVVEKADGASGMPEVERPPIAAEEAARIVARQFTTIPEALQGNAAVEAAAAQLLAYLAEDAEAPDGSASANLRHLPTLGHPRSLAAAARWKRLTILGAGVAMNLVLAVLLFAVGFMVPRERSLSLAQIAEVSPGSPAATATVTGVMRDGSVPGPGLRAGDVIMEVNGREVRNVNELIFVTRRHLGETQDWVVSRAGSTLGAEVYARWRPPAGQGPTGIRVGPPTVCAAVDEAGEPVCQPRFPFSERVWRPPWEALPLGWRAMIDAVVLTRNEIQARVMGAGGPAEDQPLFSGPVGIASATGDIIEQSGWRSLIELAALLSLSLAVFNALPIPALDGGRMFFVLVEIARGGRRISPRKEALVHFVGFAVLLAGIAVITWFDIRRLIT